MASDRTVQTAESEVLQQLAARLEESERRCSELEQAAARGDDDQQARVGALLERSGAAILVVDGHERVVWANATFMQTFSSDEEPLRLGGACHEVLCKKSKPCEDCPVLARRCGEEVAKCELKLWVKDRFRHVYATAMPVDGPNGATDQDLIMLQDLTDLQVLQQSEEALRSSEQRFRSIFEKVAAGMTTTRVDGAFLQVNPAICAMLGYTETDLLRKRFPDTVHPEDLKEFQRQFEDVLSGRRRDIELEMRYLRQDGSTVWGHTTAVWQFDADNRPTYCIHLIQDINQRKVAVRALQDSRQRYQGLINTLEGIVWEADADNFEFSFVSPQAEEILGYPVEKWTGTPRFWRNHVHPDDLRGVIDVIEEARRNKRGYELEYRIVAADGSSVWLRDTVGIVQQEGGVTKLRGVMIDITRRKEAILALKESEAQLRQAQKMEAIGRLAGGIAHDFNNILTAITGYGQLMQLKQEPGAAGQRETEEILKASRRAADLTGQLLAFSRQQVLQPKVIDLNEVIAEMNEMVSRLIGEDVELEVQHNPGLGAVKADPGQVQQVMMNLAVNARDAMPEGGRLTIATENVFIETPKSDGPYASIPVGKYVLVSLSDTGTGMSEEVRAKLFEPFFTTKEQGKGTGLGLSTVYGIVRQSGGEVTVESAIDHGSTFRVFLPLVENESVEAPFAPVEESNPAGTETILLVEDDETVRELAVEILSMNGYTLIEARNGVEALTIFDERRDEIDLVVTDVVMPQMGGRELAEKILERDPEMGVLFLSGYTNIAIAEQGLTVEEWNFLQKPFSPVVLATKVRTLIDR